MNISVYNALSIGSGLVAVAVLCMKREGIQEDTYKHNMMASVSYCQKLRRLRTLSYTKPIKRYISSDDAIASSSNQSLLSSLDKHDTKALASQLSKNGYVKTSHPILTPQACQLLKNQIMPKLFRGEFDTGNYPDEWHWREGISMPQAAREMCNSWKSNRTIAHFSSSMWHTVTLAPMPFIGIVTSVKLTTK